MKRGSRVATALLVMSALALSHASAGLVRALPHPEESTFCCCGSPEDCHCTANCCHHGGPAERDPGPASGPVLESSISCRFPALPDGSLARAAEANAGPCDVPRETGDPISIKPAARLLEFAGASQYKSLHSTTSPRGPPDAASKRC